MCIRDRSSPEVQSAAEVHRGLFGEPRIDKWTFSTNGVATAGRHKIPMIGFGPGKEAQAHAPNELQWNCLLYTSRCV